MRPKMVLTNMVLLGELESFLLVVELITFVVAFFFLFRSENRGKRLEARDGFECGFDGFSKEKIGFCIRFIKLAILFLLIDLEISFFLPFFQKGYIHSIRVDYFYYSVIIILILILLILVCEYNGGGVR